MTEQEEILQYWYFHYNQSSWHAIHVDDLKDVVNHPDQGTEPFPVAMISATSIADVIKYIIAIESNNDTAN